MLRLFARLPQILAMTSLKPTDMVHLESQLAVFVAYMAKHHRELFLPAAAYKPVAAATLPPLLQSAGP